MPKKRGKLIEMPVDITQREGFTQYEDINTKTDWTRIHFKVLDLCSGPDGLGGTALLVYATLVRHANYVTGECFPSVKRLGQLTGLSRATVQQHLRKLHEVGVIQRFDRIGMTTLYILPFIRDEVVPIATKAPPPPSKPGTKGA